MSTVNPQIRLAGLILFLRLQMRVLLEFGPFCLMFFKFTAGLIRIRVLLEGESYLRIYGMYLKPLQQFKTTLECFVIVALYINIITG